MKPRTPHPWQVVGTGKAKKFIVADNQRIATVHHFYTGASPDGHNPGHATGNAHLMAAAPDLLDACIAFVAAWEKSHQPEKTDVALRMAKAAIEKATGDNK